MAVRAVLKDKQLLRTMAAVAVPIALQNLITYMTGMLDIVMLGQLGEVAMSGSALANQFGNVFMGLTFGIASGANVLLAQYWGKGDVKSMHSVLAVMYRVALLLAVGFTLAAALLPTQILSLFSRDAQVIAAGARYLRIVCYTYLFNGLANVMLMSLRSVGTVKISIVVYTTSMVVNGLLNYALIFGKFGAPRLEMEGAAIATVIARMVELAIAAVFILRHEKKIGITLGGLLHYDHSFIRDFFVTVTPVMLNELLWSLGSSMLLVVMGRMGSSFVAANSIANVTSYFVQVFIIGIGNAVAVTVGNIIGAGDLQRARDMAKGMVVLSAGLGVAAGLLFFLVRPVVVSLYNIPDATKALAMELMLVYSVMVFFQSINFVSLMGVLRGGGDNRFVLVCDVVFLWCLAIPLGFVAGLVLGWPPAVVYLALKVDEVVKSVAAVIRIWRGRWVRDVTRQEGN